jgi:GNAT superfamily N-acetyltransferase
MEFRHIGGSHYNHIIAYLNKEYVGAIKYSYKSPEHIYIDELQVSSRYRGQGYGTALLTEVFRIPMIEKYSLIAREYYEKWGRLEAFYERNGFMAIGESDISIDGEFYREIRMEKLTIALTPN